jgi:tetratricopeptide (TPR) repeat protein
VPDVADGWHVLSVALGFDRSAAIESAEAGRKAAELDPGSPFYLMDQGIPLAYAGHVDEAIELLDAAIEIDASHASAWSSLGYLYYGAGFTSWRSNASKPPLSSIRHTLQPG